MNSPSKARQTSGTEAKAGDAPPPPSIDRTFRALVVDDDEAIAAILERILRSKGYEVVSESNGAKAVRRLSTEEFDVILTDVDMPNLGGVGLLRHVRETSPHVPVIFVTGNPTMETAVEAMKYNVSGYISKPFDIEEVLEATERALRMSRVPSGTSSFAASAAAHEIEEKRVRFNGALSALFMSYQPIIRWSTRSVYSYEALLRTTGAGVPHPGVFLDLAESLGKIAELGQNVRRKVAEQLETSSSEIVFVNLHPEELLDDDLYDPESSLAQTASRVVLEITERENLHGMKDARERINRLKQMGYRIAIDDIGAGYSGLNSFVDLEPHLVKIDMGLVRGIDGCSTRTKLVASLLTLASDLDIGVVAEGVETVGERDALVALGCDLLQGYLFAKPGDAFPVPKFEHSAAKAS